jgi:hypothetical protein
MMILYKRKNQINYPKKSMKNIIIFVLVSIIAAGGFYFYKNQLPNSDQKESSTKQEVNASLSPSPTTTPVVSTITHSEDGIEFEYPEELKELFSSKIGGVNKKEKSKTIEEHEQYAKEGGCPGTCGMFTDNPDLLLKQFDLLTKVSESDNCQLPSTLASEIKKDFLLFTGGSGSKFEVAGIQAKNGECGLKIVESSGFDVSISNFYYKVGFINSDLEVTSLIWPIFPHNAFKSVDKMWQEIGFSAAEGTCDANCYEKQVKIFEDFSLTDPVVKEVVTTYDKIISSIKFN